MSLCSVQADRHTSKLSICPAVIRVISTPTDDEFKLCRGQCLGPSSVNDVNPSFVV